MLLKIMTGMEIKRNPTSSATFAENISCQPISQNLINNKVQ
jgi:hypothetical protein